MLKRELEKKGNFFVVYFIFLLNLVIYFLPATLTRTRDLYPRLVFGFSTLG